MRIVWLALLCEGLFITLVISMPTYSIGDYGVSYNPFKIFVDGEKSENRYIRSHA